jgi:2'-5' RNA ligase
MKLIDIFKEVFGTGEQLPLLVEAKHSYGCVMLFFPVPKPFWDKLQSRVEDDDLHSELDVDGVETHGRLPANHAHVTLLYGLSPDIPDEDVEKVIDSIQPIEVTLRKISTFDNDGFDVLKFDIEGESLFKANELLSELPHTNTYGAYHPHVTLLYAKKGVITPEIKKDLSDKDKLTVKASKIVYSKSNGDEKNYPFK